MKRRLIQSTANPPVRVDINTWYEYVYNYVHNLTPKKT